MRYLVTFFALAATVIAFLAWFGAHLAEMHREQLHMRAQTVARSVLATRRWNAAHGGVYVPLDDKTPPNPYLRAPDREVRRSDGTTLTLMNPAYMTRQLGEVVGAEFQTEDTSATVRLVSLDPMNPINAPDEWERSALVRLESGEGEIVSYQPLQSTMAVMVPVWVEKPCLACHGDQGYAVGDLRGGLHVRIPIDGPLLPADTVLSLVGLGLASVAGIAVATAAVARYDMLREHETSYTRQVNERLLRSEDLLLAAQRVANVGHFSMDGRTFAWTSSTQADRILGIAPDHPRTDQGLRDLIHPDDAQGVAADLDAIVSQRRSRFDRICRIVRPCDGEVRWVRIAAGTVRAQNGSLKRILGILQDVTEAKLAELQLVAYQSKLEALAARLSTVEERERRRLAEELHDRVAQVLAVSRMELQTVIGGSGLADDETASHAILLLLDAIAETRAIMNELSHPALSELGVEAAIEWLREDLEQRYGLRSSLEGSAGSAELCDDCRAILFRGVRELLMNVVKHAEGSAARIVLSEDSDRVCVTVEDDGPGVGWDDVSPNAYGLLGVRTAFASVGGGLSLRRGRDGGTRASAWIPRSCGASGAH